MNGDDPYLRPEPSKQALEDMLEAFVQGLHDLMVMALDGHLDIKARELGQVPMRVRVLSPENGANLEDAFHVGGNTHLLGELRTLRKARCTTEVVDFEDGGTGLCRSALELGRVDLGESPFGKERTEEFANTGLDTEDRLRSWGLSKG